MFSRKYRSIDVMACCLSSLLSSIVMRSSVRLDLDENVE
jgi:hypothetical protein